MSLGHTMLLGVYKTPVGNTNLLRVTQGAKATTPMRQQVQHTGTSVTPYANQMFVFNGNVYFPFGSFLAAADGWAKYNPELDEFETLNDHGQTGRFIPLFDRVGWFQGGEQGWGLSPEDKQAQSGTQSPQTANDYAIVGEDVTILNVSGTRSLLSWPYPFSAAPTVGGTFTENIWRICELGGSVYGVEVESVGGTIDLYKVVGGSFSLVGTPTSHSSLTNYDGTNAAFYSLFKFNNKLFLTVHTNVSTQPKVRLFEIDTTTGASTERNSYLPSEWTANSTTTTGCIFEVRDDIGSSEQVFLVRCDTAIGGWECYEFSESAFSAVLTGQGDRLYPYAGVIFDPDTKAAQIKSAADTVPSDHIEMEIEVFDLKGQGTVTTDPRYRFNNEEPPPYNVCTGKVPNDSKGPFASVPSGITTLANLSDAFTAGSVNNNLWQRYAQSIQVWTAARDVGAGDAGLYDAHRVQQIGGAIRFGKDGETTAAYSGIGVKGRWSMDGAFQMDFTLKDPGNISDVAAAFGNTTVGIVGLVKLSPNEGFGFLVWRESSGGLVKVRGIYMQLDGTFVYSADYTAVDGDVIRIVRDGSNVWTLTHDPGVGDNNLTPGGGSDYSEAVYVVMAGVAGSGTSQWVEPATADGDEPGFSDLDVSGAGTLGLYDGGVKHDFDWDHVTDEPPPKSGAVQLFVDSD